MISFFEEGMLQCERPCSEKKHRKIILLIGTNYWFIFNLCGLYKSNLMIFFCGLIYNLYLLKHWVVVSLPFSMHCSFFFSSSFSSVFCLLLGVLYWVSTGISWNEGLATRQKNLTCVFFVTLEYSVCLQFINLCVLGANFYKWKKPEIHDEKQHWNQHLPGTQFLLGWVETSAKFFL